MKAIITGGAGFIGGAAVEHFIKMGDEVLVIDSLTYASNLRRLVLSHIEKVDVCDKSRLLDIVKDFKPDCVFHFAAETHVDNSIRDYAPFIKTNIEGSASVADACRLTKTRLCHVSTDEVYGPATERPFVETDALSPMNPYSATKAAADIMLQSFDNTYGLDYLIVRPSNNFGPHQHKEKFIPKLLECLKNHQVFPLYGAGDQIREWTYVFDTARLIRLLVKNKDTQWNTIYNLSSGISMKNIDASRKIVQIFNKMNNTDIDINDVVKTAFDRPGHDKKYWINTDKINQLLIPNYTSFDLGIKEIIKNHLIN